MTVAAWSSLAGLIGLIAFLIWYSVHWAFVVPFVLLFGLIVYWYGKLRWSQWKYFSPDENKPLKIGNIRDWPAIWKFGHRAVWNLENYDKWLDSDVRHARHALAIDENRRNFPCVKWAMPAEAEKTVGRNPLWLKQVWFAGCHSDVGGSYPEPESRLSDIALQWMLEELKECIPEAQINYDMLYLYPDAKGMQHEEAYIFKCGPFERRWPSKPREVHPGFPLHSSVLDRLGAKKVSHVGELKPYRPVQLKDHPGAKEFYE